jgi:hypothetical protein
MIGDFYFLKIFIEYMKTLVITEEQLDKIIYNNKIKKGIGLKINEGDSFYYKSIIKEFDNDTDFEEWQENLPKNQKVIGVIDIEK